MTRLLALSSLTLALACASTPPPRGTELTRYEEKVGVLDARASLRLQDRLERCGGKQDCRQAAIAHYHSQRIGGPL